MRYLAVLLVVGFVCQVHSSSNSFQEVGGKYYYIEHYDKLNWFDAREKCRNMDAHLVSIQNNEEWDSITDHLTNCKSYWVDIRDVDSNLKFISDTSGREAPFLKWFYGEPSCRDNYDCVKLWSRSHKMKTRYCRQKNHYICEAKSQPASYPSSGYKIYDLRYQ